MRQATSKEAFSTLNKQSLRDRVFAFISSRRNGATDDEIETALDLRHQTASARRRELVILGVIVDSDEKRKTRSGRRAIVWKVPNVATDWQQSFFSFGG